MKAIKAFVVKRNGIFTEFAGSPPFNTIRRIETEQSTVITVLWVEGQEMKGFAADFDLKGKLIGEVRERSSM